MKGFKEFLKKNLLFIVCCAVGTVADISLLNILAYIMDRSVANVISYIVGILVAFFLCRSFVFNAKDNLPRRLVSTLLVHLAGLIVQQVLLDILLGFGWSLNSAKLATIAENAILMYFLNILVVFRKYKKSRVSKK